MTCIVSLLWYLPWINSYQGEWNVRVLHSSVGQSIDEHIAECEMGPNWRKGSWKHGLGTLSSPWYLLFKVLSLPSAAWMPWGIQLSSQSTSVMMFDQSHLIINWNFQNNESKINFSFFKLEMWGTFSQWWKSWLIEHVWDQIAEYKSRI